jgi:hypothetical protein
LFSGVNMWQDREVNLLFMVRSPVSDYIRKSLAWLLISLQLFSFPIAAANEAIVENIETLYEAAIAEQASEIIEVPTPEASPEDTTPENVTTEAETQSDTPVESDIPQ